VPDVNTAVPIDSAFSRSQLFLYAQVIAMLMYSGLLRFSRIFENRDKDSVLFADMIYRVI
jgi:hypothetical protein